MRKKTQEIFAESLVNLLTRSSYDVITISEICDNTSLTRRTFYNNFSSKEDLVRFICDDLIEEYVEILSREQCVDRMKLIEVFCQLGAGHKDVFLLLIDNNIFSFFVEATIKNIGRVFSFLSNSIFDDLNEAHRSYIALLHSVSGVNLFKHWLVGGMRESPEEINSIYSLFVRTPL